MQKNKVEEIMRARFGQNVLLEPNYVTKFAVSIDVRKNFGARFSLLALLMTDETHTKRTKSCQCERIFSVSFAHI